VDLIYLDPPFFSNRHYEVIWGDEAEVRSFEDRWEGGIYHYVEWMKERVYEMNRVLKPTGSFYLHCDPHASHYLKVMLDEVFAPQNFQNEIIWCYEIGGRSKLRWARKHDVILFYSKSSTFHFDPQGIITPRKAGTHMKTTTDADGREYQEKRDGKTGKIYRYYVDEGTIPTDWWVGIQQINREAAERLGYPTQKPEALLEMIVEASSKPGDVVLDPFAGCGTSIVVAHRLKREWVGIDISPTACNLMRRRLQKVGALDVRLVGMPTTLEDLHKLKPFEFQNWIVDRINGIQSGRKSGDMGVDGHTFFLHDPVQIKQSEGIGRNVIDNFETAVTRDGKKRGFVIAFTFGRGAHEEAARIRREGLEIQLVTVEDLLERLDEVLVRMGVTSASGALPGMEAMPMPTIDSSRHSAEELIRSNEGDQGK
jgi:DNA modification methylase